MAFGSGSVKLIVGLGNPGAEYAASRHNAGFMVIEKLLAGFPAGRFTETFTAESRVFTGKYRGRNLVLQMPQTYMNLSGNAVAPLSRRLEIAPEEILVISDLGSANFQRLRIGIGRPDGGKTADYVLSGFTGEEEQLFNHAIDRAAAAVNMILSSGMTAAMNKFNAAVPETETK